MGFSSSCFAVGLPACLPLCYLVCSSNCLSTGSRVGVLRLLLTNIQGIAKGPEAVRQILLDDIDDAVTYRSNQVLRNHKGQVGVGSQSQHIWICYG